MIKSRRLLAASLFVAAALGGIAYFVQYGLYTAGSPVPPVYSYEELTASRFLPASGNPLQAPKVRELTLPPTRNATSVWGATGRDFRGHIWVGVSVTGYGEGAQLVEYDPAADAWHDRGNVVAKLKSEGVYRAGEGQNKIHSKIVPASDGWLYFASTDEEEEKDDGSRLPKWGGHLWRIHPDRYTWQHLAALPEGLVAVSGVGRYVYALGYWGHVLYQYDTATGGLKRVAVGSVGGHVSRNFLADVRGHAYVPRVSAGPGGRLSAALVEYDSGLKELGATPLTFYSRDGSGGESSHGIIGLAYLPDGRMLFSTHVGYLYRIDPRDAGPARVTPLGRMQRDGKEIYIPSLFLLGGNSWVGGVGQLHNRFEWVVADLRTGAVSAFPLDIKHVALYGSMSCDNDGRAYVGGRASNGRGGARPLVLQIDFKP